MEGGKRGEILGLGIVHTIRRFNLRYRTMDISYGTHTFPSLTHDVLLFLNVTDQPSMPTALYTSSKDRSIVATGETGQVQIQIRIGSV